ncbi:BEL1-like homeodomain protein 6 [Ipomoea triloba]|uniref:BEL1-like homeodomain protein 6 n=1 Tax=Ipomoea triloba TaxID=35885 RepID=UPI00125E2DD6|nr:BEL1-like homeodomain protein 6 [Ipomoea triloba]
MATYFSSSNNQKDASTFLYSRESLPGSYSEAPAVPGNIMMFMNYSSSSGGLCSDTIAESSQEQSRGCTDIPPIGSSVSNPSSQQGISNIRGSQIGAHDLSMWKDNRNEMLMMHQSMGGALDVLQTAHSMQGQGLSLSLGTQMPAGIQVAPSQCQNPSQGFTSFLSPPSIPGEGNGGNRSFGDIDDSHAKQSRAMEYLLPGFPSSYDSMKMDGSPYGMPSIGRAFPDSKFLKAAQQLLDEVVNVKKAVKERGSTKVEANGTNEVDADSNCKSSDPPVTGSSSNPQEPNELSANDKQELQNKLTKLFSMQDEIDRRYRQYYHQMHMVVSSFDVVAGEGAAKPYTALALLTISRHFRCLRDAISGQIRVLQKNLGDQDVADNNKGVGISRLRYVDQQLRQQRALQQLGMMQPHAWRPQRGLPESSVSILRAWLFEHFLHPYPKDSDKAMLARQTGLTRGQVSNWFINARVRLWKPMVEEIYKEEFADAEFESNSSSEIAPKATESDTKAFDEQEKGFQPPAASPEDEPCISGKLFQPKSNHAPNVEMVESNIGITFRDGDHVETDSQYETGDRGGAAIAKPATGDSSLLPDTVLQSSGAHNRFMYPASAYHMPELERFGNGNGNGVSLTLGLQQCEGSHNFLSTREDDVYIPSASSVEPEPADFNYIDPENRQHQFGSSHSHLFHDFVA